VDNRVSTNCAPHPGLIYFPHGHNWTFSQVELRIDLNHEKRHTQMTWDPITTINFVLCVIILALGIWAYAKKKGDAALYIGIAFGLFAISHLIMTLLGLAAGLTVFLIVIRLIAYLLVLFALCVKLAKK